MTGASGESQFHCLNGKRILVVGTGAPAVVELPHAVVRLQYQCPDIRLRFILTRQALQFVTPTTVNIVTGRNFFLDRWTEEPYESAPHVEINQWAEAVIVYPATLHFIGRLALGLADTPLMLALQCTDVPIALAPSLPPGGTEGYAYRRHIALLGERPNIVVAPPVLGRSMSTGELNVGAPSPFDDLLKLLHERIRATSSVGAEASSVK